MAITQLRTTRVCCHTPPAAPNSTATSSNPVQPTVAQGSRPSMPASIALPTSQGDSTLGSCHATTSKVIAATRVNCSRTIPRKKALGLRVGGISEAATSGGKSRIAVPRYARHPASTKCGGGCPRRTQRRMNDVAGRPWSAGGVVKRLANQVRGRVVTQVAASSPFVVIGHSAVRPSYSTVRVPSMSRGSHTPRKPLS